MGKGSLRPPLCYVVTCEIIVAEDVNLVIDYSSAIPHIRDCDSDCDALWRQDRPCNAARSIGGSLFQVWKNSLFDELDCVVLYFSQSCSVSLSQLTHNRLHGMESPAPRSRPVSE